MSFKKSASLIITCVLLVTSLAACGGDKTSTSGTEGTTVAANTPVGDWKSLKKYEPGLEFTMSSTITPEKLQEQNGDMSLIGNWSDWTEQKLGIKYKYKYVATDGNDAAQKLQVGIASGDLPDIISDIQPELVQQLASTDQIWCMQDLIDQYGSPLTKFMYEEYDKQAGGQGFASVSYNGKYYAAPRILDVVMCQSATQWIRKDILDELGMAMPTTIKEFESVLAAYKAKYPKGNGYIYSLSFTDNMNAGEPIFSPFGAHPQHWLEKDGKVVYGSIQPEVKDGLIMLQDWFKKGYISPDFASKDFWAQGTDFTNGDSLSILTPYWGYGWSFPVLNRAIPTSEVVPMPILNGPNGEENEGLFLKFATPWPTAISKACKNPEATIFELNMALDSFFRNDETLRAKFEFVHPKTTPKEPTNPDVIKEKGDDFAEYDYSDAEFGPGFMKTGRQSAGGSAVVSDKTSANIMIDTSLRIWDALEKDTFDSLTPDDKEFYRSNIMLRENMQGNEMAATAHFLNCVQMQKYYDAGKYKFDAFLGAPTENMKNSNAYLTKIELQTFADIITGKAGIEAFDKFVEDWNKNGGETITQEVNDWYSKNK